MRHCGGAVCGLSSSASNVLRRSIKKKTETDLSEEELTALRGEQAARRRERRAGRRLCG